MNKRILSAILCAVAALCSISTARAADADVTGLVPFSFFGVTLDESLNKLTWDWARMILWAVEVGLTVFLLRPSKCKQICESLCFKGDEPEECAHE